jgi:hypothetical protein
MSYRISLDEIDGCLIVTDGERTVKVERFATDGIREVYGRTVELLDRFKAENEKLRELVEAMPYCITARCIKCPLCSKFDPSIGGVPECKARAKLRELGIEVPK